MTEQYNSIRTSVVMVLLFASRFGFPQNLGFGFFGFGSNGFINNEVRVNYT